jgi:hypothetical protein
MHLQMPPSYPYIAEMRSGQARQSCVYLTKKEATDARPEVPGPIQFSEINALKSEELTIELGAFDEWL